MAPPQVPMTQGHHTYYMRKLKMLPTYITPLSPLTSPLLDLQLQLDVLLSLRRGVVGFKLDTLLKLADVKGTDRKTSLLHFVLEQLLKEENASVGTLSAQLKSIHPAANLQVSYLLP